MDDTWFDPDVTGQDLQGFLLALSLNDKPRMPLLAVASDDAGAPRLVLASRALFGLFGVTSADALSGRLLRGHDPGAKRLATLFQTLSLESAPRLERLRFVVGPSNEIITFLCRRTLLRGHPVFIAAALNVRAGLIPDLAPPAALPDRMPIASESVPQPEPAPDAAIMAPALPEPGLAAAEPVRDAAALQAELRQRWPAGRLRFLWQTDADAVCTLITPPLAEVVGPGTADLVGRNLLELAAQLDPSGRFADRLAGRETWSGLDLEWPLADAAATVAVVAGAIPVFGPDKAFDGFRGFGVIHLDRLKDATPLAWSMPAPVARAANVVAFPGMAKALSNDDHVTFRELGEALRKEVPDEAPAPVVSDALPAEAPHHDVAPVLAFEADGPLPPTESLPQAEPSPPVDPAVAREPVVDDVAPAESAARPSVLTDTPNRADDVGRNGLAVLDKLALGLLVSRDNVPIFANRHLLDMLGFADEDALHAAGGMSHLFGGMPGNATGSEAIGIRGRDGTILAANARMQVIDWDGLPATLLTLRQNAAGDAAQGPASHSPAKVEREPDAKRGDSELRQLRAILETATDGVAVLDADCNVLSLNRSGEALFGCDRSDVIGKPFLTLFAPHNQGLASDYFEGLKSSPMKSLLNDGREFLVKAHQGGTIPIFMTMGRLGPSGPDDASDEARFCALFRDLTHWKKAEQDLDSARRDAERASALKSDFLAKVSHEIRTPLNAIIGFAEVIMDERFGPVGNERYKDYLRDIHSSGTHVMSLVNDLLDLSKIEAGKMELQAVPVDANKIIGECVSLMQPQASRERVIMRLSLAASLPRIMADERSVRQIVLNLLSNAVKFNDPGGQVIVATALTEAGQVVIRIRDTGPGMSASDIEMALEPFRQLSNARPMTVGTGLGLPLTKALVEANQASFTIRSKVDQGTLVEVAFPPAQVLAG
jgi:PAS domain S-box-containing protein